MNIKYPLQFNHRGQTARSDDDAHIREMIEQVLFTSPGERLNRPSFGCGLLQLVFQPATEELSAAAQFLVQGALQHWLGDLIETQAVEVVALEGAVSVVVNYKVRSTDEAKVADFNISV